MTTTHSRFLLLAFVLSGVAACAASDSTSPTKTAAPAAARHDDGDVLPGDSIPNGACRSGYSYISGRCTG